MHFLMVLLYFLMAFNGLPNDLIALPHDFQEFAKEFNACPNQFNGFAES